MALFSLALWIVTGATLLLKPMALYGAILQNFYPSWVTLQWDIIQASPVTVAISVLFGCTLLAVSALVTTFLFKGEEKTMQYLLLWIHGGFLFGGIAMVLRGGFQPMFPLIVFVCLPSVAALILLSIQWLVSKRGKLL